MIAKKDLKVGIVGCGEVAQRWHIPSLLKIRNAQIVALCDRNEDLAKMVAQRFSINRYYADFSEMLEKEELDMIDICTSPQSHADLSIQAIRAGCHVLVEKPMALSLKEADEMMAASKENRVKLCVAHSMLFEPVVLKAMSMAAEGSLGELTGVDIRISWVKDSCEITNKDHWYHKLPGGVFGEMLPHPIYLAQAFLGNLRTVTTHAGKLSNYDWVAADELRVILEGEKGMATITSSCNWPKDVTMMDIFATKMNLHLDLMNSVIITYGAGRRRAFAQALLANLSEGSQQISSAISRALNVILGRHHIGHYTLIRRFVECIQDGTEPPVTAEEAREVMMVFEEITGQTGNELVNG